jgi:hypothetical protein
MTTVDWDRVLAAIGPEGLRALRAAGYEVVAREVACAVAAQQMRLASAREAVRQGLEWLRAAEAAQVPIDGLRVRTVHCPVCEWEATVSIWSDRPDVVETQAWVDWLWQRHLAQTHGRRKEG